MPRRDLVVERTSATLPMYAVSYTADVILTLFIHRNYSYSIIIIIIIIITNDNVYGAVIVTQSLREFTRFI